MTLQCVGRTQVTGHNTPAYRLSNCLYRSGGSGNFRFSRCRSCGQCGSLSRYESGSRLRARRSSPLSSPRPRYRSRVYGNRTALTHYPVWNRSGLPAARWFYLSSAQSRWKRSRYSPHGRRLSSRCSSSSSRRLPLVCGNGSIGGAARNSVCAGRCRSFFRARSRCLSYRDLAPCPRGSRLSKSAYRSNRTRIASRDPTPTCNFLRSYSRRLTSNPCTSTSFHYRRRGARRRSFRSITTISGWCYRPHWTRHLLRPDGRS